MGWDVQHEMKAVMAGGLGCNRDNVGETYTLEIAGVGCMHRVGKSGGFMVTSSRGRNGLALNGVLMIITHSAHGIYAII